MNQKTYFAALAIVASFAFSSLVTAQSPGVPTPKAKQAMPATTFLLQEINISEDRISRMNANIKTHIEELRKTSVSDIAYEDVFRSLQLQKVELSIEIQGLEARMNLIKEKVKEPSVSDEAADAERAILRKTFDQYRRIYATTKKLVEKGAKSKQDLMTLEHRMVLSELQLKAHYAKSIQGSKKYVDALFESSLAIAERKAKLEAVEILLKYHVDSRQQIDDLNESVERLSSERVRMRGLVKEYDKSRQEEAKAKRPRPKF